MHRFRDITTYWSKIAEKTYPTLIWHVPLGRPLANFSTTHTLPGVYISRSCFRSARHNTDRQTARQTDGHVAVAKTALA